MRLIHLPLFLAAGTLAAALVSTNLWAAPSKVSLSDELLMTFDDTYVKPFEGFADLIGKVDLPGLGVEYDVALYGAWEIEIGVGGASPQADLSAYSQYVMSFTNMSYDDTFNVNLYLRTGPAETYYGSGWWTLMPGMSAEVSMDLGSVANINDVREIGVGLNAWMGNEFGAADGIIVKVEDDPTTHSLAPAAPVPEASTLILFGSGLVGLLAIARKKLPFLSK